MAQRKLRQALTLLDAATAAELVESFALVDEAEEAIEMLLLRVEAGEG